MAPLSAPKMDHPLRPALHSHSRVQQSLIPGGAGGGCGASDPNPRQNVTRSNHVTATAVILSADGCEGDDEEKTEEEREGRGSGTPSDVVPGDPHFNWMFDAFGDE